FDTGSPYGAIWSLNHCAASADCELPGARFGSLVRSTASAFVAAPSKLGGNCGAESTVGRTMLNARMSSGIDSTRNELRYSRPLTGRSSVPRRARRRRAGVRVAAMTGLSWQEDPRDGRGLSH